MTLCHECGRREAEEIVVHNKSGEWSLVCEDCVREKDEVCPFPIRDIAEGYYE